MSGGDYRWHRKINQGLGGTFAVGTTGATGTNVVTGATGKTNFAIYVQILEVIPTTGSTGVTWNFLDSSGSTSITGLLPMDVAPNPYRFDFGDAGIQLPTGASFQFATSATGAAGTIIWEGYMAYKGGASVGYTNASGASGTTP